MPRRVTTPVESARTAPPRMPNLPAPASYTASAIASPQDTSRQTGLVRAALYARVSTEKQERDETIGSQVAALRQASAERGYQVSDADVFRDEGSSGACLVRPALDRLRDLALIHRSCLPNRPTCSKQPKTNAKDLALLAPGIRRYSPYYDNPSVREETWP